MSNEGGDLYDFAKDGTAIPQENPTQEVVSSGTDLGNTTSSSVGDSVAGSDEVFTATGDVLPNTVREKNLGPSQGGMEGKGGKTTKLANQSPEDDDGEVPLNDGLVEDDENVQT